MSKIIKVSSFTTIPGARRKSDGDGSAEEFFYSYFMKHLPKDDDTEVTIDFDGTWGYASSFISELAKNIKTELGAEFIKKRLKLKSDEDTMLVERMRHELSKKYE